METLCFSESLLSKSILKAMSAGAARQSLSYDCPPNWPPGGVTLAEIRSVVPAGVQGGAVVTGDGLELAAVEGDGGTKAPVFVAPPQAAPTQPSVTSMSIRGEGFILLQDLGRHDQDLVITGVAQGMGLR